MRTMSYLRTCLYGSSLALALAVATPAIRSDPGSSGVVFAQQDGQQQGGQAITPIRPAGQVGGQQGSQETFGINGTMLEITYTENAQQAEAIFFGSESERANQRQRFERAATDPNGRPFGKFLTNDPTGQPVFIILDLSWLREAEDGGFVDLEVSAPNAAGQGDQEHESVALDVRQQPNGTFLAIQYGGDAGPKGSMVNNTDFGIQERWTTIDDSIAARTDNGPDDDEARAQRENRLEQEEDDDDEDDEDCRNIPNCDNGDNDNR